MDNTKIGDGWLLFVDVIDLVKYYDTQTGIFNLGRQKKVRAVDGVSFEIEKGKTLGLVGESGCGKTTVAKCLLRLIEPDSGQVLLGGKDVLRLKGNELRKIRRNLQIIFQDPFSSLDPRMSVKDIIEEPLKIHNVYDSLEREERVFNLLKLVGLTNEQGSRFPHEFSGGQRQRIGIARALALNPEFVVADEPVSALDVSVRSQILNLMKDLQDQFNLTYLFIAHDISVVRFMSDNIAVMYLGNIVENANADELFALPLHPYTKALLSAVPDPKIKKKNDRIILKGDVPSPIDPPKGCKFHTRCPYMKERCTVEEPQPQMVKDHLVACHFFREIN